MTIHYTLNGEADLLLVRAWGFDDDLTDVENYGRAIIEACLIDGYTRILCDERELEYRLGTTDTYQAAAAIAVYASQVVKAAIVCSANNAVDAQFWETVVTNRGLRARVFQNIDEARRWLDDATA